jgi:hypothetical protein
MGPVIDELPVDEPRRPSETDLCAHHDCTDRATHLVCYTDSNELFGFCEFHARHRVWPAGVSHWELGDWADCAPMHNVLGR